MICTTAILITALALGFDGVLAGSGLTVIAALGGYAYGKVKKP